MHRDVKPGNLLVSDSDVVKLADFGIARATDQSSITQVGSVLGTAAYLAPEQARGEEAGPRADLYSLGVVTYQLLSGRLPYEATSLSELALKQQRESPMPLNELNPRSRPPWPRRRAGARDRARRAPADAIKFAEALRDGLAGVPERRPRRRPGLPRTAATQAMTAATRDSERPGSRRPAPRPLRPAGPPRAPPRAAAGPRRRPAAPGPPSRPAAGRENKTARRRSAALLALVALVVIVVARSSARHGQLQQTFHLERSRRTTSHSVVSQLTQLIN